MIALSRWSTSASVYASCVPPSEVSLLTNNTCTFSLKSASFFVVQPQRNTSRFRCQPIPTLFCQHGGMWVCVCVGILLVWLCVHMIVYVCLCLYSCLIQPSGNNALTNASISDWWIHINEYMHLCVYMCIRNYITLHNVICTSPTMQ